MGALAEVGLDGVEDSGDVGQELGAGDGLFLASVPTGGEEGVAGEITRADFDADGHAFFDPAPHFLAATDVAGIEFDFEGVAVVRDGAEGLAEVLAVLEDSSAVLFLMENGEDDYMGRG